MGDADAVRGEKLDLLGVEVDAVRGGERRAEEARGGEQADAGLAGWRDEELRERCPVARALDEPGALGGALREVRLHRQSERGGRLVHLDGARVRRVRRDPQPDPLGERGLDARRVLVEAVECRDILAEDLEEHRRAKARRRGGLRGAPTKLQSPIVVTPERRHSRAPSSAIARMSSSASTSLRRMCSPIHGTNGRPSPKPA